MYVSTLIATRSVGSSYGITSIRAVVELYFDVRRRETASVAGASGCICQVRMYFVPLSARRRDG